jgi:hypothetical protein
MPATDLATTVWDPESVAPDPLDDIPDSADELGALAFADLPRQRVEPPPLPDALLNVDALRTQYQQARADYNQLRARSVIGDGPAMRKATPQITALRARADADRPYLLAVQEVVAQWADAEETYADVVASVEWARQQLDELQAQPNPDPDDISSAQLDLRWRTMELPAITPAEQFQPALQEALAARAAAAGGAEHIVSGADVDKLIADISAEDDRAVLVARQHCTALRRDLDRAELTAAAAFAAAEIRSAEHIAAQLDELDTELRVLDAACRYQPQRPLPIAASALTDLPAADAAALTSTAALPFAVTVLNATPSDERTAALRVLHDAAIAANRNLLWCSVTQERADEAVADRLAATAATVTDTHAQITSGQTPLPPGTLIVVDHAADADPTILADLAERAAAKQSGLILLDTTGPTWPPQPARQLLGALGSELPWTKTLSAYPRSDVIGSGTPPDLDPALAQSRRLHPSLRDDHLSDRLARADQLHATIRAAYKRHLDATWLRQRGPATEQHTPQLGLNDD